MAAASAQTSAQTTILQNQINEKSNAIDHHPSTVKKHKEKGLICKIERNQVSLSLTLLAVLYMAHQFPQYKEETSKFLSLQYKYPHTAYYDIGSDDAYFVTYWIVLLTFIRSFLMDFCFRPIASIFNINSSKAKTRFAEQSWSFFYYSVSFIFGFILYYNSEYWLNCDNIYIDWPHTKMTFSMKFYYLIQMAFWLQQIFVLNIEAKRKDHIQMFSHHIITCLLVVGSYYYYFTRIGHLILVIMDSVDIVLAGAKMLKYCGYTTLCDVMFLVFLGSWIVLRHGVYNYIVYHHYTKCKLLISNAKCLPDIFQKRCWTDFILNTFLGLLIGLQIITIIWMYLILKVALKVVTGKGADDVRSDDEDTDDEEDMSDLKNEL